MITRKVLNWTERKFNEIANRDENIKSKMIKGFGLGSIEGFIDGALIGFPILFVTCLIRCHKNKNK